MTDVDVSPGTPLPSWTGPTGVVSPDAVPVHTVTADGGPAYESKLSADLDRLEAAVYLSLHLRPDVAGIACDTEDAGLNRLRLRAELLLSDIDSRGGAAGSALDDQLHLRDQAARSGQPELVRRSNRYLASTYARLGRQHEAMSTALDALQTERPGGEPADPPAWRAEALMVLTLMSMSRPNADIELMSLAQDAVIEHCAPVVVAATQAGFAEVAVEVGRADVASRMARAATATLTRHPSAEAVLTWESIARGRAASGDLAGATQAIERALELVPSLGLCEVHADPWVTAAELLSELRQPERGLAVLDAEQRPRARSLVTEAREQHIRAELWAGLGRWHEAYQALTQHVGTSHRVRSAKGDRYLERVQNRVAAIEERRRVLKLDQLATTDVLTGLPNRRGIEQWLSTLSITPGSVIAVAIVDVDHVEFINDRYSRSVGDRVLCLLSELLVGVIGERRSATRLVGRLGGDEFLIAWPSDSIDLAMRTAEQVRSASVLLASDQTALALAAPGLAVTTSTGLTLVGDASDLAGSPRPAMTRADAALQAAKAAGRNAVRRA